jgi:DNA polymerase-4
MPTIAHLDADAFYVSVELLRRPELRGRPVIVGGSGPRAVVTTASYEARRFGVQSAVPVARARRLCPEAVLIPPDFASYREMSRRLMAIVKDSVAAVEVMGLDEAYLDISDLGFAKSAMRSLVTRIERETGLTCSVGIGPNRLVAKVASDAEKPRGLVVLTREQACERFAGSPPRLLPGIGPRTAERLAAMRIDTLVQLRAAPVELLQSNFGPRLGAYLAARAAFNDDDRVRTVRPAVSRSAETTFDTDLADPIRMRDSLRALASRVCTDLAARGNRGRNVAIKVRLDDFTTVTRSLTVPEPTADAELVGRLACELLDGYAPPRPVRLLGVRVAGLSGPDDAGGQLSLAV